MREHGDDDSSHIFCIKMMIQKAKSLSYVHTVRMTYNIIQLMLGKFTTTIKDFLSKENDEIKKLREREREMSYTIGDTVKIVGGKRKGESGVIVAKGREDGRWKIRLVTGKKVRRLFFFKSDRFLFDDMY